MNVGESTIYIIVTATKISPMTRTPHNSDLELTRLLGCCRFRNHPRNRRRRRNTFSPSKNPIC